MDERPGGFTHALGTTAAVIGVMVIAFNAAGGRDPSGAHFFGGLLLLGGLLLRIEAAIMRLGSRPAADPTPKRPWPSDPDPTTDA